MRLPPAWRESWWWWVLPCVVVVANAGFYAYNYAASTSGFRQIQDTTVRERRVLVELRAERQQLEETLEIVRENRTGLDTLYGELLATREERFTEVVTEVKNLARRVGLEPPRIGYRDQRFEDFDLDRLSLVFGVSGSYREIRELINLLELSPRFLILEEIRLREEREGARLDIDLALSTLFASSPSTPEGDSGVEAPTS